MFSVMLSSLPKPTRFSLAGRGACKSGVCRGAVALDGIDAQPSARCLASTAARQPLHDDAHVPMHTQAHTSHMRTCSSHAPTAAAGKPVTASDGSILGPLMVPPKNA